jgi:hypothetical protein
MKLPSKAVRNIAAAAAGLGATVAFATQSQPPKGSLPPSPQPTPSTKSVEPWAPGSVVSEQQSPAFQLENVSRYRQDDPDWATQTYNFGGARGTLGHIGCTISAIGNALKATGVDVKPTDMNNRTATYREAMGRARFTDLSGRGAQVFDAFSPIARSSARGQQLEARIKESLEAGHPVVIGMTGGKTGRGANYPRHSVTAVGLNAQREILVVDGWRHVAGDKKEALVLPLTEAMTFHGKSNSFDIALEVKSK